MGKIEVIVREFVEEKDGRQIEEVETRCEVGPTGKLSLFTHLLGDPLCRIRHSPSFRMLVAELVEEGGRREIVGMIRGCIKIVTCGKKYSRLSSKITNPHDAAVIKPIFTKVAYILGLRVSPSHRRMGIAKKLVSKLEEWFRENGVEYSYLATESDNEPSVSLFTQKFSYSKFRTPSVLVQPVFAHRVRVSSKFTILRLSPQEASVLYRRKLSTTEFFPRDIDSVLSNRLSLATFLAVPCDFSWAGVEKFLSYPPLSWAVLSSWNCNDVWRLEVKGASRVGKGLARTSRVLDRALPWLRIPSFPELFKPFGLHFLYGLGGEGQLAVKMVKALCGVAHNLAQERGCSIVATEVAFDDPLRVGVPHWKKLSCEEDLWCIKRLGEDYSDGAIGDWTKSPQERSIFVDPREF